MTKLAQRKSACYFIANLKSTVEDSQLLKISPVLLIGNSVLRRAFKKFSTQCIDSSELSLGSKSDSPSGPPKLPILAAFYLQKP